MTLLYDSDNPDSIPNGVNAAGYCDGYAASGWNARGWARFPNAIRIAVFASTNDGHALDVEAGDASPWEAPGWVRRRWAAGIQRPWIYCNRANGHAVEFELSKAGIQPTDSVALWIATLDGAQTVTHWNDGTSVRYPIAAVQYANSTISGGHYDLSITNEVFGPGGGTIGGTFMTALNDDEQRELLAGVRAINDALFYGTGTPNADPSTGTTWGTIHGFAALFEGRVRTIVAGEVAKLPVGAGGTEPPEPAEPKTVTLDIPAQKITGTLT